MKCCFVLLHHHYRNFHDHGTHKHTQAKNLYSKNELFAHSVDGLILLLFVHYYYYYFDHHSWRNWNEYSWHDSMIRLLLVTFCFCFFSLLFTDWLDLTWLTEFNLCLVGWLILVIFIWEQWTIYQRERENKLNQLKKFLLLLFKCVRIKNIIKNIGYSYIM